jgi:Tfp pilus assembly protein PilW
MGRRLAVGGSEAGLTLVELLVASAMSVILLGALGSMLVSAMKHQPELTKRADNISTARWVLERMTREIRNGVRVDNATPTSVSFQTYVRHATCGSVTPLESASPSIKCEVTYNCTPASCSRIEAAPKVFTGTETMIFSGIDDANVFTYLPNETAPTYIGIRLHIPNPSGSSATTVSDGASLRNSILAN